MLDRSRFSFPKPSAGDRLLAGASQAKINLTRWPGVDGEPSQCSLEYELRGDVQIAGPQAATIVQALVEEFRSPRQDGAA